MASDSRLRRGRRFVRAGLCALAICCAPLGAPGCAFGRANQPQRVRAISGIAALQVSAQTIEVKQADAEKNNGLKLMKDGLYTERAAVLAGETFVLVDGRYRFTRYHVLAVNEQRESVVLKEEEHFDGSSFGQPTRQAERIISVKAYGPDRGETIP